MTAYPLFLHAKKDSIFLYCPFYIRILDMWLCMLLNYCINFLFFVYTNSFLYLYHTHSTQNIPPIFLLYGFIVSYSCTLWQEFKNGFFSNLRCLSSHPLQINVSNFSPFLFYRRFTRDSHKIRLIYLPISLPILLKKVYACQLQKK